MLWFASTLVISFCKPTNAPHGFVTPVKDVFWEPHWERLKLSAWEGLRSTRGKWALSRALAFWKCCSSCVVSGGASWPWLQHYNRWPTGHPWRSLLVPSSCHICFTPRLRLPGDYFLTDPHSHHHGYTIPIVANRPQCAHRHTNAHTCIFVETLIDIMHSLAPNPNFNYP